MPRLPVFISLGLLGVLAVIAAVVVRAPGVGSRDAGEGYEEIRLSQARAIEVRRGDERSRVERTEGGWIAAWQEPGGERRWPVDESTVRAAIRLINEGLRPEPGGSGVNAESGDWAVRVTIRGAEAGRATEVRMGEPRVGGVADAAFRQGDAEWQAASIEADLFELFSSGGPRAWRDPRVGTGLEWDPGRIVVAGGPQGELVLEKQRGTWVATAPVAARCEPDRVRAIVAAVTSARVLRFVDAEVMERESLTLASMGLASAIGRLSVESARGDGARFVLEIGAESPRSATSRYARVTMERGGDADGGAAWGPMVAEVDVEELGEAFPVIEQVAARTALGGEPLEVGGMTVRAFESGRELTLSRRGVRWEVAEAPVADTTQQLATALTERLLAAKAARVTRESIPATRLAQVELFDYRGGSVGSCLVAIVPAAGDQQRPVIAIESEGFTRLYDASVFPADLLRWLAAPN
ncbi:MAG: hypothetical protein ACF8SC_12410 [Phycisphaerales bacterium JB037]